MNPLHWRKRIDFKLEIKQWKKYKIIKTHFTWWMMMNRIPFLQKRMSCGTECFPLNSACILACCSSLSCFFFLVWFSFKTNRFEYKYTHLHTASCNSKLKRFSPLLTNCTKFYTNIFLCTCRIDNYIFSTCFTICWWSIFDCACVMHHTTSQDKTRLN